MAPPHTPRVARPAVASIPGIDGVAEIHRVGPVRPAAAAAAPDASPGPRLNLLLPTLNPGRTFGGARTALDLFEAVAESFPRRRIVTFTPLSDAGLERLPGYAPGDAADSVGTDRQVVAVAGDGAAGLEVGPADVFLATFWTTAELAIRLARWQAVEYGNPVRPIGYLVQDFEPGFYPWSAQSELARATYASDVPTIAVINTSLLRDHLAAEGVAFVGSFTFEPRLAAALRGFLDEPARERRRQLVAYGRPETPRNAFPLVVDALRSWTASDPKAAGWEVVSAGRPHPPVELGGGRRMRSLGTLSLDDYGALLRESAVGLSLMVSPHPSYPPLDMAHLGMLVVTNRFGAKDLSTWHENIRSAPNLMADGVAAALRTATDDFEADPLAGDRGKPWRDDFLAGGDPFPFAAELAERLLSGI